MVDDDAPQQTTRYAVCFAKPFGEHGPLVRPDLRRVEWGYQDESLTLKLQRQLRERLYGPAAGTKDEDGFTVFREPQCAPEQQLMVVCGKQRGASARRPRSLDEMLKKWPLILNF
jgi:hypothetical protein